VQQQLNTLQQEMADLQSRLDDLEEGSSSSKNHQQQQLQPQQVQDLEQKFKQGDDELAEQVLQLDLQLQMVSAFAPVRSFVLSRHGVGTARFCFCSCTAVCNVLGCAAQ
jgi:predicted nuclease with TOPRIM domain